MSEYIGHRIQKLRKIKGLTQEDLAERTKLSVRTIQRIEKGDVDPRNYTINVLAEALEVEISDLLPESEINLSDSKNLSGWNDIADGAIENGLLAEVVDAGSMKENEIGMEHLSSFFTHP